MAKKKYPHGNRINKYTTACPECGTKTNIIREIFSSGIYICSECGTKYYEGHLKEDGKDE